LEGAARGKAEMQISIRKSKPQLGSDHFQNLRGGQVDRAATSFDHHAGVTVKAQMDREGKQANTTILQDEMRTLESVPLNEDDQYYELPQGRNARTKVTEKAVEWAVYTQLVKKAPGPDKLCFGAIHLLWKCDTERIRGLVKATIRVGRHPAVWMGASGVVICIPSEDDYKKLTGYHTMSLLTCTGMVFQTVGAELLPYEPEQRPLQCTEQFGKIMGRSAINAAASIVD
jgi:hypothetical protein